MISLRKLVEYVSAEPFRPFRINLASRQSFEVRHPENIAISRSTAKIFAPKADDQEVEAWHDLSLMLMESIEPLDKPLAVDEE